MVDLLFYLAFGHFLGDFALQSDRVAAAKHHSPSTLTYHVALYTLTIALTLLLGLTLNGNDSFYRSITVVVLGFIFVEHWLQDYFKGRTLNGTRQGFYLDQALHLLILFGLRVFVYNG